MKLLFSSSVCMTLLCVANTNGVSAFTPSTNVGAMKSTTTSTTTTTQLFETTTATVGVERNRNFAKLAGGYLFPEIGRRRNLYLDANPDMKSRIISLGIGDTTQPIPSHILSGLQYGTNKLGVKETYTGYGNEQGNTNLRTKIAETLYNGLIEPEEVFVSGMY